MGYVYKIKNEYVLPEEIYILLEMFGDLDSKDERLTPMVSFYISANGVLDIDKLVELVCKSGIKITKKLKQIIKKNNYVLSISTPKIIYSHMTALYFHGLSIKAPDSSFDITVTKKYNSLKLKKHNVFYVDDKYYELGLTEVETPMGIK